MPEEMTLTSLLLITFLYAAATDLATGLGAVPFFFVRNVSSRLSGAMTAMAAGMMISASLVQLVGEALELAPGIRVWEIAAGLLAGAAFYLVLARFGHNERFDIANLRKRGGSGALMIVLAMTIHSFPEGAAVGVAFAESHHSNSLSFGLNISLAIAVHNIPEGLAIAIALRARGISTWACVGWAIFSSLPQPIAAPPAAWAVWLVEPLLPAGMAFAAGAMMYLVIDELMPDAREKAGGRVTAVACIAGIVLMIVLGRVFAF